jgi:hypothetical protein
MSVMGALPFGRAFFVGVKVSAYQAPSIWNKTAWRNLMLYGAYLAL